MTLHGNPHASPPHLPQEPTAIPDLIYPALQWGEADYAQLQVRLDLYDDFVILSKFKQGQVSACHLVDPTELAATLAGLDLNSGLLPRHCLFWGKHHGADRLGIFVPPQVWLVSVRDETEAWRVPLPGLVFTGHDYDYGLWAVKDEPTGADTPLYLAPCPNVHPQGVCRGSAPFPRASATTIWHALDIFFSSKFNRDLSNHKSKAYPDCILDQWQALHQANADVYPLDDLIETHFTLRRLIHVQ
ncbi:MAG: hypothetical protein JXM69_17990 [Anaerolineae bacterium]|nr:hypothetical protein [Anaerolineae bacterium]